MKNNKIIYTLIGIIIGVLGTVLITSNSSSRFGTHQMPDGSIMRNDGADMTSMMHDMTASLKGKTGNEFDRIFLAEMIIHHKGAVDMAEMVLTSSTRPELIKLAHEIISAQTKEIEMMEEWQRSWFK